MAIVQCPDCGKDVSTMAATCPNCGYPITAKQEATKPVSSPTPPPPVQQIPPAKKGVSPWTIIGWIMLALVLLFLYSCMKVASNIADSSTPSAASAAYGSTAAVAPDYRVKVVKVECDSSYRDKADITIRNTGSVAIPFAKVFVEFTNKDGSIASAQDSYFSPTTIPPGATASATVYSKGNAAHKCGPTGIQDGDGNQVTIES